MPASEKETSAEKRQDNGRAHTPIAWLRDAHKGEGDECLVPASEGDPGAFAVYTELVVDDLLKDRRDLLEALKWIEYHYANQDMSHVDFRVEAYNRARSAIQRAEVGQ